MNHTQDFIKNHLLSLEYQPIIHSKNESVFAYEARLRPSTGIRLQTIYEQAFRDQMVFELDFYVMAKALQEFPKLFFQKYLLFIPVVPTTITHPSFIKSITILLKNEPEWSRKIVLQIHDDDFDPFYWKNEDLYEGIQTLKKMGFAIAFENLQAKTHAFEKIERISPHFIKYQSSRLKGISVSKEKQELMILFLEFSPKETSFILGGIDTKEDYNTARQLEIPFLQGNYFSKPGCFSGPLSNLHEK